VEWDARKGRNATRDFLSKHTEKLTILIGYQGDRAVFFFGQYGDGEYVPNPGVAVAEAMLTAPVYVARGKRFNFPSKKAAALRDEPSDEPRTNYSIDLPRYITSADADRILPTHSLGGDEIPGHLLMNEIFLFVTGRKVSEDPQTPGRAFWKSWSQEVTHEELDALKEAAQPLADLQKLLVQGYRNRKAVERAAIAELLRLGDEVNF